MFPLFSDVPGQPRPSLSGTRRRWSRPPAPEPCTGRRCHVPESSHHQPSQEHPHAFAIGIHDVRTGPPHEGELGEGVLLQTDRGDIQAILHQAPEAERGVIWVGGARGGFGRPGQGAYARLAEVLRRDRISSLRLSYRRHPYACGVQFYHWAQEPKQLVLYEGAEHRLDECADALDQLLTQWILATLRSAA